MRMPKACILYIEDSETQGLATARSLEQSGYAVLWVRDGMSAIRAVKTRAFDVIILDYVLPDVDGNRLSGWLKQEEKTRHIPIIMLTSMDATAQKVRSLEAGADDYLVKPCDAVELNARVYAALRTKKLRDELARKNDELQALLAKVQMLSVTDPLTGLFNRRRFEEALTSEFKRAVRYRAPLSCLMLDIDHFKKVNDTCGHAAGDTVLREVARLIKQCVRDVDTVSRWGGEEFSVLAPLTTMQDALVPARRILAAVAGHSMTDAGGRGVTLSIGVADLSVPGVDAPDALIRAADKALYEAKEKGRNRIESAG